MQHTRSGVMVVEGGRGLPRKHKHPRGRRVATPGAHLTKTFVSIQGYARVVSLTSISFRYNPPVVPRQRWSRLSLAARSGTPDSPTGLIPPHLRSRCAVVLRPLQSKTYEQRLPSSLAGVDAESVALYLLSLCVCRGCANVCHHDSAGGGSRAMVS